MIEQYKKGEANPMMSDAVNQRPLLSDETFRKIRDLIAEKTGIYFHDNKRYLLEMKLSRRIKEKGFSSFEEYLEALSRGIGKEEEFKTLVDLIVTKETSFFRDLTQFEILREHLIPDIMKSKNGYRSIRIWSSACSTGEEPYTIAMVILEEGIPFKGWNVHILASDINEKFLKYAQNGRYEAYSVRNTPPKYLEKYFIKRGDEYVLKRQVRELVKFRRINLIDSLETGIAKDMDIVFCRNVLIYFDEEARQKAMNHIHRSLSSGGYLFLGFSELMHEYSHMFKPVMIKGSMIYQKI